MATAIPVCLIVGSGCSREEDLNTCEKDHSVCGSCNQAIKEKSGNLSDKCILCFPMDFTIGARKSTDTFTYPSYFCRFCNTTINRSMFQNYRKNWIGDKMCFDCFDSLCQSCMINTTSEMTCLNCKEKKRALWVKHRDEVREKVGVLKVIPPWSFIKSIKRCLHASHWEAVYFVREDEEEEESSLSNEELENRQALKKLRNKICDGHNLDTICLKCSYNNVIHNYSECLKHYKVCRECSKPSVNTMRYVGYCKDHIHLQCKICKYPQIGNGYCALHTSKCVRCNKNVPYSECLEMCDECKEKKNRNGPCKACGVLVYLSPNFKGTDIYCKTHRRH